MIGRVPGVQGSADAGGRQRETEAHGIHPARHPAYLAAGAADTGRAGSAVVAHLATARERGRPEGARASEPTVRFGVQRAGSGQNTFADIEEATSVGHQEGVRDAGSG